MKRKSIISLILCVAIATCALFGCGGNNDEPVEVPNATITDEYLVKDFKSDYSILIPASASSVIRTAADELQTLLYDASGCELPIVTDGENYSGKVISLGETKLQKSNEVYAPYAEYGDSGYKIQSVDGGVIVIGGSDTATLYGTYKFLQYHIDFKAYSTDYVTYDKDTTVPLYDFDGYSFKPDMPIINVHGKNTEDLSKLVDCARMGQISTNWMGYTFDGMLFGGGLNCHSAFKLISPSTYYDEHPDWFNETSGGTRGKENLCLTNEEMREEYVKNLKAIIEANPGSQYYMLGNEDNRTTCRCANCVKAESELGGAGGIYVKFLNAVSDDIDAWIAEEYPERVGHVFLGGLGYFGYVEPPVTYDENGNPTAVIKLKSNIYVEYCTHDGCQSHAINDPDCSTNATIDRQLRGWSAVSENLMIYTYTHNYRDYYLYFNNWGAIKDNMRYYKEIGVKMFYVQGPPCPSKPADPFVELRQYLYVELAKDVNADYYALANDFIDNYYGVAAGEVKKFWNDLLANFQYMETVATKGNGCWGIYPYMFNDWREKQYWTYDWMQNETALLKSAIAKVEAANYSESETDRMVNSIINLLVPMQYRTIEHYSAYFSEQQLEAAKSEYLANCARAGITGKSMFSEDNDVAKFN